ncbi:DUF7878 domain-containing protein [Austwickia chelonae]|uniref:DUF7878 domain-containing protein n=1 Tax=Austwickia chelonae NBRC 105200 TaxID=1184607 RepID=K6W8N9_9MICO|nr:hypothetical protein [Austwickia chelonae]GAB78187.1 hypothetical protein AUCHE_08_04320 [Austwickia chelonae NBRC 105200]
MEIAYDRLNSHELTGTTQTDYLVALDAHFMLIEDDTTIYDEPGFPVVELARSMVLWLRNPDNRDFIFDSMSYEEVGSVIIRQDALGWTFTSVFAPDAVTAPIDRNEVERCCRSFVSRVEADLWELGVDPDKVFRQ